MASSGKARQLRTKLAQALERGKLRPALDLYDQLEALEPTESRWPHRRGDLLARLGEPKQAIEAYERAVSLYADQGFVTRAAALAKLVLELDASRLDILERVDPEAARRLHREQRSSSVSAADDVDESRPSLVSDAPPLRLAADSNTDELRFEDETSEIDVSEISVVPPRPPPLPTEGRTRISSTPALEIEPEGRRTAEQLARLPSMPLFVEVPRRALDRLLLESSLIDLTDGEQIMRAQEPADSLYVVLEGALQVHVPSRRHDQPILLGEGDVVGESCLLANARRGADVIAVIGARVLAIPKEVLDQLVSQYPRVGDILFELLSRRLIANLVQTSPMFVAFDPSTRVELARLFEVRRASAGTTLIKAGLRADGLYIALAGNMEIERPDHPVVKVGNERIFGQRSLISAEPSDVTVRLADDGLLLRLPAGRFLTVAAQFPTVLEHLSRLADSTYEVY